MRDGRVFGVMGVEPSLLAAAVVGEGEAEGAVTVVCSNVTFLAKSSDSFFSFVSFTLVAISVPSCGNMIATDQNS